jgi:hypothetical protein
MKPTESTLVEVDLGGDEYHLSLTDSSRWLVNPEELPSVASWQPETKVRIELQSEDDTYSYKLTNLSDDNSITAMKIG